MREITIQDQVFTALKGNADAAIVLEDMTAKSTGLLEHEEIAARVELKRAWGCEAGGYDLGGITGRERSLNAVCRRGIEGAALLGCGEGDKG